MQRVVSYRSIRKQTKFPTFQIYLKDLFLDSVFLLSSQKTRTHKPINIALLCITHTLRRLHVISGRHNLSGVPQNKNIREVLLFQQIESENAENHFLDMSGCLLNVKCEVTLLVNRESDNINCNKQLATCLFIVWSKLESFTFSCRFQGLCFWIVKCQT